MFEQMFGNVHSVIGSATKERLDVPSQRTTKLWWIDSSLTSL